MIIVRQGFRRLWIDPGCECIVRIEEFQDPERLFLCRRSRGIAESVEECNSPVDCGVPRRI